MPPIVTCHPHPPTYIIPGTCGRHHDMMIGMVKSEVMAMLGGYRAAPSWEIDNLDEFNQRQIVVSPIDSY